MARCLLNSYPTTLLRFALSFAEGQPPASKESRSKIRVKAEQNLVATLYTRVVRMAPRGSWGLPFDFAEGKLGNDLLHSALSATIGSTRVARRAGR